MNGSIRPRTGLLLPEQFQFSKGTTHSPRHIRLTRYCTYLSRPIGKDSWNFRRCQLSELFRTRKRPRLERALALVLRFLCAHCCLRLAGWPLACRPATDWGQHYRNSNAYHWDREVSSGIRDTAYGPHREGAYQ